MKFTLASGPKYWTGGSRHGVAPTGTPKIITRLRTAVLAELNQQNTVIIVTVG
jgi:hypothetical protein